jgi:hypothetical protein
MMTDSTVSNQETSDNSEREAGSRAPICCAPIGSQWEPKRGGLPWKVTDIFRSEMGRIAVQLEKYQGGRNSPAIITTNNLKKRFRKL